MDILVLIFGGTTLAIMASVAVEATLGEWRARRRRKAARMAPLQPLRRPVDTGAA